MQIFLPLHRFILFLCLFSIIKNTDSPLNAQPNWIEQKKYGVVHVIAYDKNEKEIGNGSGVVFKIMDGTAYIVTNNHVVKGASRIIIQDIEGKEIKILGDVRRQSEIDLAILITSEEVSANMIALNLDPRKVSDGEKVYLYGYPSGDLPVGKPGLKERDYGHKIGFLLEGGDIIKKTEGFSGGSLLDEHGNLIGIYQESKQGTNYAIESGTVITVIEGLGISILNPTSEEKLGVWIARIEGDNQNKIQKDIINELRRYTRRQALLKDKIEVRDLKRTISQGDTDSLRHNYARNLGKQLNAQIISWGDISRDLSGGDSFDPRITIASKSARSQTNLFLDGIVYQSQGYKLASINNSNMDESKKNREIYNKFIVAYCFYQLANMKAALKEFEDILEKLGDFGDPCLIGDIHLLCGIMNWYLYDSTNAEENLESAKSYFNSASKHCYDDALRIAHIKNNLGLVSLYLDKEYDTAMLYFNDARKRYSNLANTYFEQGATYNNLALAYLKNENYTESFKEGEAGLEYFEKNMVFHIPSSLSSELVDSTILDSLLFSEFIDQRIHLSSKTYFYPNPEKSSWMLNDKYNYKKYLIKINKDSLSVYKYPELYAQLKNNIGNAYYELSKQMNKEENIREAIKAFDDALTVRQREISAIGYAKQNMNLGYAYISLGDSIKALKYVREAHSTYQTLNNIPGFNYARKIEEAKRLIEDLN